MSLKLPQNGQWIQSNRSDVLGNLQGTFNVDLTRILTKTHVTRMIKTTSGFNGVPVNFVLGADGLIYTFAGLYIYHTADAHTRSAFVQDSGTGTPNTGDSLYSDITLFNNIIYGSTYEGGGDRLVYGSSASWQYVTGLGQTGPHMLASFPALQKLYITISTTSKVFSLSTGNSLATSGANTLTLDINYRPTCIETGQNRVWIGTMAFTGEGPIYEWDGAATQPTRSYSAQSRGVWAMVIKDDIPWIVNANGYLMQYSNGVFVERARFPLNMKLLANATNVFTNNRPVHPKGMKVVDGKIQILLNNVLDDSTSSTEEFCPSGIWEFDETIGLYHKYSLSYLPISTNTITDYGQERLSIVGGLAEMKTSDNNIAATGNLLAGAQYFTNGSATAIGSFTNDTFEAVSGTTGQYSTDGWGYLVTSKIPSPNVKETWQKIYAFYKKLMASTGRIIIKFRTAAVKATEASITWVDTTSFTTSDDISAYAVGDEVEVTQGSGSGRSAHITAITGTYTVTIEESVGGTALATAKARFQKWTKIKNIVQDQTSQFKEMGINTPSSTWIQFKVCMLFKNQDELEALELINQANQPNK